MIDFDKVILYDWVDFFGAVSKALAHIGEDTANRNKTLRNMALDVFGNSPQMTQCPYYDPFSFVYQLAQKNTTNQLQPVYTKVKRLLKIDSPLPSDRVFPTPSPQSVVLFFWGNNYYRKNGGDHSVDVLWKLFEDAVNDRDIDPDDFNTVLDLKGVKVAKLTQVLFLINPKRFWSVDDNSLWLPIFKTQESTFRNIDANDGYLKYQEFLQTAKQAFQGCDYFEINLLAYLVYSPNTQLAISNRFIQISSMVEGSDGVDHIIEFYRQNAVWTGSDGSHKVNKDYELEKANAGDVVLVRRGIKNLGGIAVLINNQYKNGYDSQKKMQVVWINKSPAKLDKGLGDWKGFNVDATDDTWEKFYSVYPTTLDLIEDIKNKQNGFDKQSNSSVERKIEPSMQYALNTILYGPPGTGKTYHTIVKAAEIIKGQSFAAPQQYNEAKAVYRQQLGDQVEFVTFHQNYSYEDFVAGLRPDTRPDTGGLQFKEHRGIFYRLCQKARQNWEQHSSGQTYTEPSFDEVLEAFLQPLYEEQEIPIDTLAYGKTFHITGNNNNVNLSFRKHSGGTAHTLSINTLRDLYEGKRTYNPGGLGVYYSPLVQALKTKAASLRKDTGKVPLKKYVLIIDEINRANISRVFGELITLLEEDKRLGAEHELRLRLPGLPDGELFGVPPNLYIVGTMNTADKSIALIDIALRRRFVFEDKYPRPETVQQVLSAPYDGYLLKLNEAIRQLKGADFMIGHAYLIGKTNAPQSVADVFNQKIIPLLNEYFYNQRNTSVYGLLTGTGISLPGLQFEQDEFIGARAIAAV